MNSTAWPDLYRNFAGQLPAYARNARITLCGLASCIDAYLRLHENEDLFNTQSGTRQAQLANELLNRVENGIGGEFHLDWKEGGKWIEENLRITNWGIGGTGAQAAQALATLGAPALMSLEDRCAEVLDILHPGIEVATASGIVPCVAVAKNKRSRPAHYIFEYTSGKQIAGINPSRSSRTIVRFADDSLDADPDFVRESINKAGSAGAGILCGFNEVANDELEMALDQASNLAGRWLTNGLGTIHLELGGYTHSNTQELVLERLCGTFTSLGMSLSELDGLLKGPGDPIKRSIQLAERWNLQRVCVHADSWAIAVTRGDPEQEFNALLCGNLLASSRAEAGRIVFPKRPPDHAVYEDRFPQRYRRLGKFHGLYSAAPYLKCPTATIGLGDTFLAGTLLVLGQTPGGASAAHQSTHHLCN
jgi:ADP-dependent phosphofructokinase/glucokinase